MDNLEFFEISLVECPEIESQWQAGFLGVFPTYYNYLPATHFSDKAFFERYWEGDNYTTYEQFIGKKC